MGALTAAMSGYVAELKAADIRATDDPTKLNPPCVILGPPAIPTLDTGCGGEAVFKAYVVGLLPGNLASWRSIDDLAEAVGRVIPVEAVQPVQYQETPDRTLPALELTWTRSLDWPSAI